MEDGLEKHNRKQLFALYYTIMHARWVLNSDNILKVASGYVCILSEYICMH